MNGVPEYYGAEFKQTSKGIWYCDGLKVFTKNMEDSISVADEAMTQIESVLEAHNKEAEE